MKNEEYYSAVEFKKQKEYKPFLAEEYRKPLEIGAKAPEMEKGAPEYSVSSEKKTVKSKQGQRRQDLKKVLKRVSDIATKTVGTTVGTVAAAAAAVVVGTNLLTAPVTATLEELFVGANYAAVQLSVDNLVKGQQYRAVLTGGEVQIENEVVLGENDYLLQGLTPSNEYILRILDDSGAEQYQTKFTTQGEDGEFFSSEFLGSYERLTAASSIVYWGEESNQVELAVGFSCESELYEYRAVLVDGNGEELAFYEGKDTLAKLEVPLHMERGKIRYEEWFVGEQFRYLYSSFVTEDEIVFTPPTVNFSPDKKLVGAGAYKIPYRLESACEEDEVVALTMWINGEEIFVEGGLFGATAYLNGYTTAEEMTVRAEMTVAGAYGGNERTVTAEYIYRNEFEFYAKPYAYYDLYSSRWASIDFAYCAPEGAYVLVTNLSTGETAQVTDSFSADIDGVGEYSYALYNADGVALTDTESVAFDMTVNRSFTFNAQNPLDILITYNDDGTQNLHLDLNFSSDHEDVYYEVYYGSSFGIEGTVKSREKNLVIENLPITAYYFEYAVCCEVNGLRYDLQKTSVSGTTAVEMEFEEFTADERAEQAKNARAYKSIVGRLEKENRKEIAYKKAENYIMGEENS